MSVIKKYVWPAVTSVGVGIAGAVSWYTGPGPTKPAVTPPPPPPAIVRPAEKPKVVKAKARHPKWVRKCYPPGLTWPMGGEACYWEEQK